jgi:hypothetical protein
MITNLEPKNNIILDYFKIVKMYKSNKVKTTIKVKFEMMNFSSNSLIFHGFRRITKLWYEILMTDFLDAQFTWRQNSDFDLSLYFNI